MPDEWTTIDDEIGRLIAEHGVEKFRDWPVVHRTMLRNASFEENAKWQERHFFWLEDMGAYYNRVVEIGAGTGQFARLCSDWDDTYIVDLPNVRKIQAYVCPKAYHAGADIGGDGNTLAVSLWAMSEMPYDVREQYWESFKDCHWFFAFQYRHNEYRNLDWFLSRAIMSGRRFTLEHIAGAQNNWYMYIDGKREA